MAVIPVWPAVVRFVISTLTFWLAVGFLPFSVPVAAWFQRRLQSDPALPPMDGTAAAKNMTSGQIVLFSVAAIFITTIIMLNVAPPIIDATNASGASGLGAAMLVLAGAAMIVAGALPPGTTRVLAFVLGGAGAVIAVPTILTSACWQERVRMQFSRPVGEPGGPAR